MKNFFKKIYAWLVSEQFLAPGISWPFFFKGLFMTFISAAGTVIYLVFESGSLIINWHVVLIAGLSAAGAYIMKNLFTDEHNRLFKFKPKDNDIPTTSTTQTDSTIVKAK
jgi:hypothetical protein